LLNLKITGKGGLYEAGKKRMWLVGLGLEFRMKLYANEPRMVFDLHDFDQVAFWIHARYA
jgi:hypothetical protein